MTSENKIRLARWEAEGAANDKYNGRFNNAAYQAATKNRTVKFANALIDEALALCGSPHHKVTYRAWSPVALDFLALFVD